MCPKEVFCFYISFVRFNRFEFPSLTRLGESRKVRPAFEAAVRWAIRIQRVHISKWQKSWIR